MSDVPAAANPPKKSVAIKVIIGVVIAFVALFLIAILSILAVTFLGASSS